MEINLEKNEERMADVINIENVAEVQPVVASDEQKTEPVGTTPPAENSCKSAPKRQRCCWITVGFVVLFAAVITLFILFFTQKGADSKSNPALASLIEKGETPYMLTVNNDSIVANFVLVKRMTWRRNRHGTRRNYRPSSPCWRRNTRITRSMCRTRC